MGWAALTVVFLLSYVVTCSLASAAIVPWNVTMRIYSVTELAARRGQDGLSVTRKFCFVALTQDGLLHLAHGVARQFIHDENPLWHFERGKLRA